MKKTITLLFLSLISGCGEAMTNQHYNAQEVSIEALSVDSDTMKITYRTPLESLYFSPGINVVTENGKIVLTIVRCNINDQCNTDSKAELSQGLYQAELTIPSSLDLSDVYVTGEGGVVKIQALTETTPE